ncbi:MAG: VWA domain-containing protein [Planctomycetota bacterium]|nr:MAG: VWA domain-containing protein [Planctomycetota bacterium]
MKGNPYFSQKRLVQFSFSLLTLLNIIIITSCHSPAPKGLEARAPMMAYSLQQNNTLLEIQKKEDGKFNTESYDRIYENPFLDSKNYPLSTFAIDVDTASYSNIRRFLKHRQLPPKGAVRIEEMVNYFSYHYPSPKKKAPFSVTTEVSDCPWNLEHRLLLIGLQAKKIEFSKRPPTNIVFLLDVSGSMAAPNKLGLVKRSIRLLVNQLTEKDKVSIVVYAGASGLVLPPTSGDNRERILEALDRLTAGGSTNGGEGIQLAYRTAIENFIPGGVNKVILCTDGDFNVGMTDQSSLIRLIEEKAKSNVFLTVLGFGMGNYKDSTLEKLADKGNGNYGYIDNFNEAKKYFIHDLTGTLITVAKDVKIQVEFNPAVVAKYRLIGYENRIMRAEDFANDKKDGGEVGAGHQVTALYELVLAPSSPLEEKKDKITLKYQGERKLTQAAKSGELATVKVRYKDPEGQKSTLLIFPVVDKGKKWETCSKNFKFAAAVAAFGMILRESPHRGKASYALVRELAREGMGEDKYGYRKEFLELVGIASGLSSKSTN